MKYDFELDTESSNSLSIIIRQLKENTTVLEFGPANGRLTRYMKEKLNCQVYLAELDEEAGKEALEYGVDLVVGDIENYQWVEKYNGIRFDHIIFADVLEHLRNPLKVLVTAKEFLKEDGTILLSVPNLSHNSVLIDLMNDKFEYNPIGLLDDTHIHFFTKTSLDKIISDAGLFVKKEMATYAKVGTIEIKNSVNDVECIKPAYWNRRTNGQVYQYVYEITKKSTDTEKLIDENITEYYFQIYYDEKGEWKEDKSIIYKVDISKYKQNINVKLPAKVRHIRIDCLNNNCIVKMNKIAGRMEDEEVNATKEYSNEKCMIGDLLCFDTNDPQIVYTLTDEVDELQVEYEIYDLDFSGSLLKAGGMEEVMNGIERLKADQNELNNEKMKLQSDIELLKEQKKSLESEKEALRQTAQFEKERADILQAQRNALESKKIYKIYKFFKRK